MAERVEAKRAEAMKIWGRVKAKYPLEPPIKRALIEAILRALGYKKRRVDGESLFVKTVGKRSIRVHFSLKTYGESDRYPPSQRLLFSVGMADQGYAEIEAEIFGDKKPEAVSMGNLGERKLEDYVLSKAQIEEAIAALEADTLSMDADEILRSFRRFEPSRPGSAGLRHLAALALNGDIDILSGYASARAGGETAGFVPFITDAMIARALEIAQRQG